jgi:hypothetical protein
LSFYGGVSKFWLREPTTRVAKKTHPLRPQ